MDLLPARYNRSKFRAACEDPAKFTRELKRIVKRTYRPIDKYTFCNTYGTPTNVMKADWDTLIILDAARYDLFASVNTIDGELTAIVSQGSKSNEFMEQTFVGETFHDTVYVSANGFSHKLDDDIFHEFVSTYTESQREVYDNNLFKQYHPEIVCELAIETYDRHRDKRLIVHMMQPHPPYFGPIAEQLRQRLQQERGIEFSAWTKAPVDTTSSNGLVNLLQAAANGYITPEEFRTVYVENLELGLEYAERLLESIDGKTIITADHGEMLGDVNYLYNKISGYRFGHPRDAWIPELRLVPWLVLDSDTRRTIVEEPPVQSAHIEPERVENHLKALGYTV